MANNVKCSVRKVKFKGGQKNTYLDVFVKSKKDVFIVFKSFKLNEFESYCLSDDMDYEKCLSISLNKGISETTSNEYILFNVLVRYDLNDDFVPFKNLFISKFECQSLKYKFGYDLNNLDTIVLSGEDLAYVSNED